MGTVIRKTVSSDGKIVVGQLAPSWTQNSTISSTTDGRKSTRCWMSRNTSEDLRSLDSGKKLTNWKKNQLVKEDELKARELLKKKREPKQKVGAKQKMSDEQALFLRREAKIRSVSSLCRELKISRTTADNCLSGVTYKHLDHLEKPLK